MIATHKSVALVSYQEPDHARPAASAFPSPDIAVATIALSELDVLRLGAIELNGRWFIPAPDHDASTFNASWERRG